MMSPAARPVEPRGGYASAVKYTTRFIEGRSLGRSHPVQPDKL